MLNQTSAPHGISCSLARAFVRVIASTAHGSPFAAAAPAAHRRGREVVVVVVSATLGMPLRVPVSAPGCHEVACDLPSQRESREARWGFFPMGVQVSNFQKWCVAKQPPPRHLLMRFLAESTQKAARSPKMNPELPETAKQLNIRNNEKLKNLRENRFPTPPSGKTPIGLF